MVKLLLADLSHTTRPMSHLPKLQKACRRAMNQRQGITITGPRYYEYEEPTGDKDAFYTYRVFMMNGGNRYVEVTPNIVRYSDQDTLDALVLNAVDAAAKEIEGGNTEGISTPTKELDSN